MKTQLLVLVSIIGLLLLLSCGTIGSNDVNTTINKKEKLSKELFGPTYHSRLNEKFINNYLDYRKKQLPSIKKMTIRELLSKVKVLPYWSTLLKGDIYSEEIINRSSNIMPKLVDLILDDQNISKVKVAGVFNYFIGDVAAWIIHESNRDKYILHKFLLDSFNIEGTSNPDTLSQYYNMKLLESVKPVKSNKKNRILLYEYIKNKKYDRPDIKYRIQ